MSTALEDVINEISTHRDSLTPSSVIKECISRLESTGDTRMEGPIKLLRSQMGIWGSDDTQMFSRQLTAEKLAEELSSFNI